MLPLLLALLTHTAFCQEVEMVGKRPYEMDWAGRNQDDHPPLVGFEDLTGWTVETKNSVAKFGRTREQQIFDKYVAKLTYRADGVGPEVRIVPPEPIRIAEPFDAISCWIYGNNWGYAPTPATPQVTVTALFTDSAGKQFSVPLAWVNWEEWFLNWRRLSPEQIESVKGGADFNGFLITGGRNKDDRVLYFDNLAVFTESFPELHFEPRPERGIPMFPGQTVGTNNGPGKLPFPTRPETILPPNLTADFKTSLTTVEDLSRMGGTVYVFTYEGADGKLVYGLSPKTGTLSDLTAQWEGRGGVIQPCAGGGVTLTTPGVAGNMPQWEQVETKRVGDTVVSTWRMKEGEKTKAGVTYTYRLWGKSLVIDVVAPGGNVAEVRYGKAVGLENPRIATSPFYVGNQGRPAVAVSGPAEAPLFLAGNTDWYLTNASEPFSPVAVEEDGVVYNGGTRYIPLTDGKRNDCFERFFITLSPRFEEVLPVIPNPESPWKSIAGTHVWRAHGAGNRDGDAAFWRECYRHGMRSVLVTDHETGWRDGGESFTFRTRPAPGKGGDEGQYNYARIMQDELGFRYGPYNNYTDFAPVNEYWSPDLIGRSPDNQLQGAWMRCYAPKPARAVEYCAKLAPIIQGKFQFSTAYCDVHTAVAPWHRVDYDARVPGAGTMSATFYSYGEIMLHQKKAWNGPVYSEGNHHAFYSGLTDGNYGQDQAYRPAENPWLVDFDLRRMHDLCCNFGMGAPDMFYPGGYNERITGPGKDAWLDRFLCATVAFGHPGFLTYDGGIQNALRGYFMLQQLHSRYCLASAVEIRYADAEGKLLDSSAAVASGAYKRNQVVTRYSDGTITAANGSITDRLSVEAYGRKLDLPSNGYAGWTEDGKVEVQSADPGGWRSDYADTPAYVYADGRGRFMRFAKAASNGIGVCRTLEDGGWEIIPFRGSDCGFAISAISARAFNKDGRPLGPAELRTSRGLTYVVPVEGAFSYELKPGRTPATVELTCPRDQVVPGETVLVRGEEEHEFQVPADAKPGDRIWQQFEGGWIDFTAVPLADAEISLRGDDLRVELRSNLAGAATFDVTALGRGTSVDLQPGVAGAATIPLGPPQSEAAEMLEVTLRAGDLTQSLIRGLRTELGTVKLMDMPQKFAVGMCLRGGNETPDLGQTNAHAFARSYTCGDVDKSGVGMHPPYVGGSGYVFALYDPIALPAEPMALRAFVGKGDGSDPGDGILYKVEVVDEQGIRTVAGETTVTEHRWLPIEADLSAWANKTVSIKLIADCGPADDTSGDWACWAEMQIGSLKPSLLRTLDADAEKYRRETGPFPVAGLTVAQLRAARSGWLRYDGQGLEGTNPTYGSFARLNGLDLGNMAQAGGDETQNVWAENVGVPLTPEAIQSVAKLNHFALYNPGQDFFKVRRFWIELELADGTKCSSLVSTTAYTQPPSWQYAEGIGVPHDQDIQVDIWFDMN